MTASGEVMREPSAHVRLERWYRRLLWAYPIGYRRAHGEEILTMLMDSAEPDRRMPARADVVDLVRGAVRQWFRLPIGRMAVVAAVLSAVILGAVGAGVGSWLAWQAAALPSDASAIHTAETVRGVPLRAPKLSRDDWLGNPQRNGVNVVDEQSSDWTLEAAKARLQAEGWTPGGSEMYSGAPVIRGGRQLEAASEEFYAIKDGAVVTVSAVTVLTPGVVGTSLATHLGVTAPRWEPVAIMLGGLVGAVIGWLLTGWAGYRLRRRTLPRRLTVVALGLTALWLAAGPTIGLYETLADLAFPKSEPQPTDPAYFWLFLDRRAQQLHGALAMGLAILVVAAMSRRQPEARPTATVS
ncbi:hypothetical protein [Micromonospora sp. DT231]|uniref:hypothetical protein n=1 Tax=Micromonospora sp. DT231 TaxID=3416526 RepID=UPI003CF32720